MPNQSYKSKIIVFSKKPYWITDFIRRYAILVALTIIAVFLAISTPSFLTLDNLRNLFTQTAVLGIVSLGLTILMISGEMDVSMGSLATLCGALAVGAMTAERGLIVALVAAAIGGVIIGLINGAISVYGRVPSLISTLTIAAIIDGISLLYTGGYRLYKGILPTYRFLGTGKVFGIPTPVLILLFVIMLAYILMHRTAFGRRLYAVGGNQDAARLAGLDPKRLKLYAFVICSAAAALAGVVVTARSGTAEPFARFAYTLDAFAIVYLGTTLAEEGEPTILGTCAGILILSILNNGMVLVGVPFFAQSIFKGVLILLAVISGSVIRKRRS